VYNFFLNLSGEKKRERREREERKREERDTFYRGRHGEVVIAV
jgi:hypothetical protein